jgi:methionine sulfoxide reductase heme-binding subunit
VTTWVILRAAGIGAYVMVWLSVVWGLTATTGVLGKRVSRATATTVHQFISTCGLFLLAIHIGGLLLDTFTPFSVANVTIPFSTTYKPVAVAFGIVSMYTFVFVVVTSWLRKRIGTVWWRRTHVLAVPVFAMSLVHGLFAGTDTTRAPMWWMYLGTGLLVVFLVLVRGLSANYRPVRTERVAPPQHRAGQKTRTPGAQRRPARPASGSTGAQRRPARPAARAATTPDVGSTLPPPPDLEPASA